MTLNYLKQAIINQSDPLKFPKTDFSQFGISVPKGIHPNYLGGKCILDDYKMKQLDQFQISSVSSPGSFPYLKNYNEYNSSKQQSPPLIESRQNASPQFGNVKPPKFSENLN